MASFTIINLLVASLGAVYFFSLKGLSEGPAGCYGCKALRGSSGYLRVQISGRASSKVKAAYSTRVNEERGARRRRNWRQRTRTRRMGDNKKKREKRSRWYYVVWEKNDGVLGSPRLLRAPITSTPLQHCYLSRYWWSTESRLMILTPPTNYERHRVPAEEVGLYPEILLLPFAHTCVSTFPRLRMHLTSRLKYEANTWSNYFTVVSLIATVQSFVY